jgi:hypothetical protein
LIAVVTDLLPPLLFVASVVAISAALIAAAAACRFLQLESLSSPRQSDPESSSTAT